MFAMWGKRGALDAERLGVALGETTCDALVLAREAVIAIDVTPESTTAA